MKPFKRWHRLYHNQPKSTWEVIMFWLSDIKESVVFFFLDLKESVYSMDWLNLFVWSLVVLGSLGFWFSTWLIITRKPV